MNNLPKLSKEDVTNAIRDGVRAALSAALYKVNVFDAIREGTHDAIGSVARNATSRPCADFYDAVQAGVKEAITELQPEVRADK